MGYVVYFEFQGLIYKLPVNPEEMKEKSVMAIEKMKVLGLGSIAVPTDMELRSFSFETELPASEATYSTTGNEFYSARDFLKSMKAIRDNLLPVRFVYGPDEDNSGALTGSEGESVLVLIEQLELTDKAGEEGDKYVSFELLEYKDFGKRYAELAEISSFSTGAKLVRKKKSTPNQQNPKSSGYYVVKDGDSLWSIAKAQLGDGAKCNIIFWGNPNTIKNPAVIRAGWRLKIPTKDEFSKYDKPLPRIETKVNIDTKKKSDAETLNMSGYNISGYRGGSSPAGKTHSSGGGKF
jgi:LysM repeat protein